MTSKQSWRKYNTIVLIILKIIKTGTVETKTIPIEPKILIIKNEYFGLFKPLLSLSTPSKLNQKKQKQIYNRRNREQATGGETL